MPDPENEIDNILNSVIPDEQTHSDTGSGTGAYSGPTKPSDTEKRNVSASPSEEFTLEYMRFENPTYHLSYTGVDKTFCGRDLSGVNYKSTTTEPELLDPCKLCQKVNNEISEEEQLEQLRSTLAKYVAEISADVDTPNAFKEEELAAIMIELPTTFSGSEGDVRELRSHLTRTLQNVNPNDEDPCYFTKSELEALVDVMEGNQEKLIPRKKGVYLYSEQGRLKRTELEEFRTQRRDGKGVICIERVNEERLAEVFVASPRSDLLLFTSHGLVHQIPAHRIPNKERVDEGDFAHMLFDLESDERIQASVPVEDIPEDSFLTLCTRKGFVKRTHVSKFQNIHRGGIQAVRLESDDQISDVALTDGSRDIVLGTKNGRAIRFEESEVRTMGRAARGVHGIHLKSDDAVVGMTPIQPNDNVDILTVTSTGVGKRTNLSAYKRQQRNGTGLKDITTGNGNGTVVDISRANENEDVLLTSALGQLIRISAGDISRIGRNTKGIALMDLDRDDEVTGMVLTPGRE